MGVNGACRSRPFAYQAQAMTDLASLNSHALSAIDAAATLDALEAVRIDLLGKQGSISALLKTLGQMSPEERQTTGAAINSLREAVTAAISRAFSIETSSAHQTGRVARAAESLARETSL